MNRTARTLLFSYLVLALGATAAAASPSARWIGQDGSDWAALGPGVGPDGLQDVGIELSGLSPEAAVRSVEVQDDVGTRWESGVNLKGFHNAELVPNPEDRSRAVLRLQPPHDLNGRSLKLTITDATDRKTRRVLVGKTCDPNLAAPMPPPPRLVAAPITVEPLGQDGAGDAPAGAGAVHLRVGGLAGMQPIVGIVLTDSIQGSWVFRADRDEGRAVFADDGSAPLIVKPAGTGGGSSGDSADLYDLYHLPDRDEAETSFTLRVISADGRTAATRFSGSGCDPGLRNPRPSDARAIVKPGDDLHAAVNRGGTVVLAPGTYRLDRPLVLEQPVVLTTEPGREGGATLLFSQAPGDSAWTTAVKIRRGHTTLNGFKVRFTGPIRWKNEWTEHISYGSAVIGATDNFDAGYGEPLFNLTMTRLDLEAPPVPNPAAWTEAVRLMRLIHARNGYIAGCLLRGGPIEFFGGPWRIENNRSLGTVPGTVAPGVVSAHAPYRLSVRGNWAEPDEPHGKTWRFLVMTNRGVGCTVANNTVKRIGPRDDDSIPWANAPETILTESYRLAYEGRLRGRSSDGRLIQIGAPQGLPARTGAVVALLDGPDAGSWRTVAQTLDPSTYLLDEPISEKAGIVSIAEGFINLSVEHNTVENRGGSRATHFVLAGNHFGTRLVKNRSIGADEAIMAVAYPTEQPMFWGWSHSPFFGGVISDNVIEDSARGGRLGVERDGRYVKSNRGRLYMAARVDRNVVRWSDDFAARQARSGRKEPPTGLILGARPTLDPAELRIEAADNRVEVPAGSRIAPILSIPAAEFNSQRIVGGKFRLAGDPGLGAGSAPPRPPQRPER